MVRGVRIVAFVVLAGTLAACGSGFDPAKAAAVESVPVPQMASTVSPLAPTTVSYRVAGVDFADLTAWYERQLPQGRPFGAWAWCEESDSGISYARIYSMPGTTRMLAVTLVDDTDPGIVIGTDDSGPCKPA